MSQAARTPAAKPADISLGQRLRDRRLALDLTLKDVGDRAGLSVGFISQIERGIAIPSITSLINVARVLGASVTDFLAQPKVTAPMTRQSERPHYAVGSNAVSYERLSTTFPGNVLRSLIIHEPPGFRSEPVAHEGEEIFFILEGALTIEIDGELTILETGDSIHFPSIRTHATWNHTTSHTAILHTCTMDIFGEEDSAAGPVETSMAVRRNGGRKSSPKPRKITNAKKGKQS